MAGRLPLPLAVKPVIPLAVEPLHAKAVLAAAVEAVKLTAADNALEQMVWFSGVLVTVALGLTVMVTVNGVPAQVPSVGVTLYVAVTGLFVVFVNVWLMEV
jgi:hypothetical protein